MEQNKELSAKMFRLMLRIRVFEEAVIDAYSRAAIRGLAHPYIGEEAVAVGACSTLRPEDYCTGTHRGHGHVIAKGGRLDRMMAELMGKVSGYNRGKGGTMHVANVSLGILGANGIVGAAIPIATGAALSSKLQGKETVVICFLGEGAVNQGVFLESINFASLWKLPVIFMCENNQYVEYSPYRSVTAGERIGLRAAAVGIPEAQVDGQDVEKVYETTDVAVRRARAGQGPSFIEALTYRYRGHNVGDPGGYRTDAEIQSWKARDPIALFERRLLDTFHWTSDETDVIRREVKAEMEAALKFAQEAELPQPSEVFEHVYG